MENDLISRSALKKHVNDNSTHWLNEWDTAGVLLAIEKAPAVDAVEVVRCKQCDSFDDCVDPPLCGMWGSWTEPEGWCHKGERRADDEH